VNPLAFRADEFELIFGAALKSTRAPSAGFASTRRPLFHDHQVQRMRLVFPDFLQA